ncbi:unnamed protein product, partial [Mesorhabditis spiculigera]
MPVTESGAPEGSGPEGTNRVEYFHNIHREHYWLLVKLQGSSTDDMQVFVVRLADGRLLVNLEDKFDYTMTGSEEDKKKWSERHCAGRNFEKYTSIEWHAGRKAQPSKASAKCETSEQKPIRYGATGAQLCVGCHDGKGILNEVKLIDPMEMIPREVEALLIYA